MQYDQNPRPTGRGSTLAPLPAKNIDTGLGLNRMAAILQESHRCSRPTSSPLIELGEELSGARYGEDSRTDRALRILADHSRAMTFLIADGVVPSNEDRGYVLRRVMRRAIQQGRELELAPGFLVRYAERVREIMGGAYPELREHADAIDMWLAAEEEGFGRTLTQGMDAPRRYIEQAREAGALDRVGRGRVPAARHLRLPAEMTSELLAEEGL